MTDNAFGSDINIFIYHPIAVDALKDEYTTVLNKQHDLVLTLEAYRLLREQNPYDKTSINHLIDNEIHTYFTSWLNNTKDSELSATAIALKYQLLTYLNDAIVDDPKFRNMVLENYSQLYEAYNPTVNKDVVPIFDILSILRDLIRNDRIPLLVTNRNRFMTTIPARIPHDLMQSNQTLLRLA